MIFLDILLCVIFAYGVFRGLVNGFFIELASLLSLVVGIWAAIHFSDFAAAVIGKSVVRDAQVVKITAFVITFIAVVIAVLLIAKFFTTVAKITGLGPFNAIFGAMFGLLKMILIVSVVLNVFMRFNANQALLDHETLEKSTVFIPVQKLSAWMYPSLEKWASDAKNAI